MSAVLSAVRSERSRPSTRPITCVRADLVPVAHQPRNLELRVDLQTGLLGTTGAGHDPGHAGHESGAAARALGQEHGRQVAEGKHVLSQHGRDGAANRRNRRLHVVSRRHLLSH